MKLFENEIINISKIHTVAMYTADDIFSDGNAVSYNVNLPTYELIFFLEGENLTHFSGVNMIDSENTVRYLPKGVNEGKYTVERRSPSVCIDIYFDTPDPMPPIAACFKNMQRLKKLFVKLYNVWRAKKDGYYTEAMSIMYAIIAEFKSGSRQYRAHSSEKLKASYAYMLDHYCDTDFDYRKMCDASGFSYDRFKELFKSAYGSSPVKYVTSLKIGKAKELLITGHYKITEIAEACGFENIYYFSTVFKKETGIPPSRYVSQKLM